jgi:ankyrin repeat protein
MRKEVVLKMTSVSQPVPQTASLPARPSLENLRNQAKSLLKSYSDGNKQTAARFEAVLPNLRRSAENPIRLANAQFVIAREMGFPSWPKLKAYVESITGARSNRMRAFHTDVEYYEGRADGLASQHSSRLPLAAEQIRKHHPAFASMPDDEVFTHTFTQQDARLVTAREHGFETWSRLRNHIRELAKNETAEPFLLAFQAIETHDLPRLQQLLSTDDTLASASGTNGNTLLNLAASCRFMEGTKLLLAFGADANQPNVRGSAPLHQAAYSNQPELAQLLLDAGAIPDTYAHGDGGTPLVMALFWGHREVAELLSRYSLAPSNLRVAAGLGNLDLMRSLFDTNGCPLPHAGAHRDFYRPHSGFPVWHPTDSPQEVIDEAFVWAAKNRRIESLEFLLQHGANINADPYRGTALTWVAAGSGDLTVAKWLLDHGANVNLKATFGGPTHGEGITALHMACQNGKMEMAKLLIANGADPKITDDLYGGGAVGHAGHFGHVELAEYLRGL